jgi:hypothetical protein
VINEIHAVDMSEDLEVEIIFDEEISYEVSLAACCCSSSSSS